MCPYSFNMAMPSHSYYILKKKKRKRDLSETNGKKKISITAFSPFFKLATSSLV